MVEHKKCFKASLLLFFLWSLITASFVSGMTFIIPDPVEPVVTPGALGAPVRIAPYTGESLLVTDYSSGKVYRVNKRDLEDIQPFFTVDGKALAIGHFGKNIIVGNATTGNVEVYNRNGKFLDIINYDAPIVRPSDLAVYMNKIFIVDSRQRQVKVYSKKRLLSIFGSGELVNPVGIALDNVNQLAYVSDHGDSMAGIGAAIFVFTYEGTPLDKFESADFGFDRPRGIAYDQRKLYITDTLRGVVTVIDVENRIKLGDLGSYGSEPGQLIQPQDVVVDSEGTEIFVANKRLGRIEKISTGGLNNE